LNSDLSNRDEGFFLIPSLKRNYVRVKKYKIIPANMPRWDLRRKKSEKIEGMGVIFP